MKNTLKLLPIGILTMTTAVSGATLSATKASAADTTIAASVGVSGSCKFTNESTTFSYSKTVLPGNVANTESDTKTSFDVWCNDSTEFYVYAIGSCPNASSPSTAVDGETALYSSEGTIATGTNTTGNSSWAFKVTSASGGSAEIATGYDSYSAVPSSSTPIVTFTGSSSAAVEGSIRTDYQIYVSSSQETGTYTGGVKYTILASS